VQSEEVHERNPWVKTHESKGLGRSTGVTDEQKRKLEQKLWAIADTLRGKMNADEFRDYILGFIFYKYLSERLHLYANGVLKQDGIDFLEIDEKSKDGKAYLEAVSDAAIGALGYFLKPSELFRSLAQRGSIKGQFIIEDLQRILTNIEKSTMGKESEDDFDDLFSDMDLTSSKLGRTEAAKNELIAKVLTHLDEIDFELEKVDSDVLGDAYEYLIGKFASGAGKKAGEFYTPQEVSTILARIVTTGKARLKNVYDPTCGSGSLLLRVAKEAEVGEFFGQEMNRTTYNLARMNMILHGVHYRNFDLKQEDTLEHPQHLGRSFEAVVANPPFSANWSANPLLLNDDRYGQYGRLAPSSKADFAFVQHMLHQLDDNGTMAVILPHGVLFRGGAEGHIREYIIKERNWLDAVIGLPANIFYGTSIPTCILVLKKCREHPNDILFVDASTCFEKAKNQNLLLPEHIERIVAAYRSRAEEPRFAVKAALSTLAENDYNLNIPRYVDTFEAEEQIDLAEVARELQANEKKMAEIDAQLAAFCRELGIEAPL
jgi:type I restriction enzyme M protein